MKNLTIIDQTRPDQTRPDQNYGLSLLRIWMSFQVVLAHFWHSDTETGLFFLPFKVAGGLAVPVFMFTAFLLSGKMIQDRDRPKIAKRLNRLVIMHIGWAAIYTIAFASFAVFLNKGRFAGKNIGHVLLMFAGQVFIGHTVNGTMWFQADLIFITAIFALIYSKFSDRKSFIVMCVFCIVALFLQYSGINFMLFGGLSYYFRYTPGRFFEMILPACAGMIFAKYDIIDKLKARWKIALPVFAVLSLAALKCRKFTVPYRPQGFHYSGIFVYVIAVLLTVTFILLPLNNIPNWAKSVIRSVSRFTPGIYCMHMLIAECLKPFTGGISGTFIHCAVIYTACLCVSFILSAITGKYSKYLVG